MLAGAYAGWAGSLPPDVVEQRLRKTIPDLDLPPAEVVSIYNVPGLLTEAAPRPVVEENAVILSDFHPAGMKAMARAVAEADLREMLDLIEIPTMLLYGDRDVRSPLAIGEELHARIPGSRMAVIPGAGHLLNIEAPDGFNSQVRGFLRSTA